MLIILLIGKGHIMLNLVHFPGLFHYFIESSLQFVVVEYHFQVL